MLHALDRAAKALDAPRSRGQMLMVRSIAALGQKVRKDLRALAQVEPGAR